MRVAACNTPHQAPTPAQKRNILPGPLQAQEFCRLLERHRVVIASCAEMHTDMRYPIHKGLASKRYRQIAAYPNNTWSRKGMRDQRLGNSLVLHESVKVHDKGNIKFRGYGPDGLNSVVAQLSVDGGEPFWVVAAHCPTRSAAHDSVWKAQVKQIEQEMRSRDRVILLADWNRGAGIVKDALPKYNVQASAGVEVILTKGFRKESSVADVSTGYFERLSDHRAFPIAHLSDGKVLQGKSNQAPWAGSK